MTNADDVVDVIEAFADGEFVAPASLARALADQGGRDHLIDLLTLRGLVGDPGIETAAAAASSRRRSRLVMMSLAATLVIAGTLGGFVAGERAALRPAPSMSSSVIAPQPTQVIRLEPGVDWTEGAGGH